MDDHGLGLANIWKRLPENVRQNCSKKFLNPGGKQLGFKPCFSCTYDN